MIFQSEVNRSYDLIAFDRQGELEIVQLMINHISDRLYYIRNCNDQERTPSRQSLSQNLGVFRLRKSSHHESNGRY